MSYLKDRQEYVDRYDQMTVKDCRWHENFHLNYADSQEGKTEQERKMIRGINDYAWSIEKIFLTLHWYDKKEATIQKWMNQDEKRDQRLENARVPENIFCDVCYSRMKFSDKHLWDLDDKDRVLFFFDCPQECKKRKAIYDDGELYIPKPHLCEKCGAEVEVVREKLTKDNIKTTYKCVSCKHEQVDTLELSSDSEEDDPKFEYDRSRFCLAGQALFEAQEAKRNFDFMREVVDKMEEKEQKKDLYEEAAKIQKLTVPQIKELITKALDGEKYLNVSFEKPDLGHIVSLSFSLEELETDNERQSSLKLKKLLNKVLSPTNWRLMTDGVSYRLGVLSGRVRVYEKDEDLVKLLEKHE